MTDSTTRIVRCPTCGGPSVYAASNPFRPFCGERCCDIDLGAWASESYRVGASPSDPEPGDTDDGHAQPH